MNIGRISPVISSLLRNLIALDAVSSLEMYGVKAPKKPPMK